MYARVLDEHLETALDVMTDMVFAPSLADLDAEREVVLEEIAMVEDSPQELIFDLVTKAVFGRHPLGRPVLGSAEVISAVSRRSLIAFHRRRYRPDNVVVADRGKRRPRQARDRSSRACARKPATSGPEAVAHGRRSSRRRSRRSSSSRSRRSSTTCAWRRPASRAPTADASRRRCSTAILGGSASSRLFQEIREKRGLAYAVYTFSSQYADTGQIGVYVGTREENLAECLRIVSEQIGDLAEHGPRPDELERAKENLKGRIMLSMETTSNRMSRLGKSLITDSELLGLDRILAEIEAVDVEAVAQLAEVAAARGRALRRRHRAERGAAPRGRRAGLPRARGARRRVRSSCSARAGRSAPCSRRACSKPATR